MKEHHDKPLFFAGSVVLGLNDALIEITGVLVGLTLAFQDARAVLIAGLVTGIAASLSMAASGYLEAREQLANGNHRHPGKEAVYTGGAYIITVLLLIAPYTWIQNPYKALIETILIAIAIIGCFSLYVTTERKTSFWKQFWTMFILSMSVAAISFGLGYLLRIFGLSP